MKSKGLLLTIAFAFVAALALPSSLVAQERQQEPGKEHTETFQGEVADSQCALNVHSLTRSHQEMLKSKNMGGTSAACTRFCIKNMGPFPTIVLPS